MKVVIFFAVGLFGGVAAGSVGRAIIAPPPLEEELAEDGAIDDEGHVPDVGGAGEAMAGDESVDGDEAADGGEAIDGDEVVEGGGQLGDAAGDGVEGFVDHDAPTEIAAGPMVPQVTEQPFIPAGGPLPTSPADTVEAPQRLAQIFGSMDADAAAEVLVELSDGEVTAILAHLSARRAGAIIENMPPQRAANLSRAILVARGGS